MKIGFLGPKGTFSYEAILAYKKAKRIDFNHIAMDGIPDAIECVHKGILDKCIVPIENSIEGAVNFTLDALNEIDGVIIEEEFILPIHQHLLVKKGFDKSNGIISEILSHPQPLGQCKKYLRANYPNAATIAMGSTALAAAEAKKSDGSKAAIGTATAADIFDLEVLCRNIHDENHNSTRFVVVRCGKEISAYKSKTSVVFSSDHTPGSLYKVLAVFNLWDLNLSKIESRPSRKMLGEYLFFVDIISQSQSSDLADALNMISRKVPYFKCIGTYDSLKLN